MNFIRQSQFARMIGVSNKTVTLMKQKRQIVMVDGKVDVEKSMELLRSIGRTFDKNNKMIKHNTSPTISNNESEKNLLNTEFIYPTLSPEEREANKQREVEELQREAEKEGLTLNKVLTEEISSLEPIEVTKIKTFWQGQLEKIKYEKEIGKLIDVEEVYSEQFRLARTIRDALMGMSARVAPSIIGKKSIFDIRAILDAEIVRILEGLSR